MDLRDLFKVVRYLEALHIWAWRMRVEFRANRKRRRTLDDTRELVVLVKVDELLLRRLGRRPMRRVTLPAERQVRQVEPYFQ